mmetsp:Transcript_562/g.780  ORF Transcript_562/g.780 Transcript_562/m.780 type:complete len:200 (+) Transcript_562:115-714(+)
MTAAADFTFKVLLIGDSGVGKSSILLRYTESIFTEASISNLGVDFKTKTKEIDGKTYRLQIWDTAGQERFRTMTSSFYRGAQGVIVVFDPTKVESFSNVRRWFDEVERNACEELVQILVASKIDLNDERRVTANDARDKAAELGVAYHETSAKTDTNITELFDDLLSMMRESAGDHEETNDTFQLGAGKKKKKGKTCSI